MTTVIGAIIIFSVSWIWGRDRVNREKEKISVLKGLLRFVSFVKEEITNFRTPLLKIYENFSNESLGKIGFCTELRNNEIDSAMQILKGKIPNEAWVELSVFLKELGGGYSEGQASLCDVVFKRLEETTEDVISGFDERTRMYRLLPPLAAASVIILLI